VSARILVGDVRERLAELPDASVQTVVTSPPYFNLRDYGTAQWEGGDDGCDHTPSFVPRAERTNPSGANIGNGGAYNDQQDVGKRAYRSTCGKCGAVRVDQQIGLEPTPAEYVAALVDVFREVRRVLRPDGTVFLNLGDSYATSSSSAKCYTLRDDLSDVERRDVCLGMFGMRLDGYGSQGQGSLPQVLSREVDSGAIRTRAGLASQGIKAFVSEASREGDRAHNGTEPPSEMGGDSAAGREVRLLRGDGTGVPDSGSHQRRRCSASPEDSGQFAGELDHDLSGHQASGIPNGRVPSAMHELQLLDRCLGILSSSAIPERHVPNHLRRYFRPHQEIKPKDLIGIPWRVAFALQDDGWYLRSDIIWAKPNPMPESVTDRPTKSHEYLFLLTKRDRYYYDAAAIAEPVKPESTERYGYAFSGNKGNLDRKWQGGPEGIQDAPSSRNKRSVWTIPTQGFPGAHFATFPEALVEPCILAGTSERGGCPACGAPWRRVVERETNWQERRAAGAWAGNVGVSATYQNGVHGSGMSHDLGGGAVMFKGWEPSCVCDGGEPVPQVVLDPFTGSGTVGVVSLRHGRRFIGIDLNPEYVELARRRITNDAPLFNRVEVA